MALWTITTRDTTDWPLSKRGGWFTGQWFISGWFSPDGVIDKWTKTVKSVISWVVK